MSDFFKRVLDAQNELKAPKNQYNSFGKYNYRSCEDILEAVKPICKKYDMLLNISDKVVQVGDRYYIEATATLYDALGSGCLASTASAREADTKKGMDESQVTGTASSYARKYALNGLFNIDDTKDADTDEHKKQTEKKQAQDYMCSVCGTKIEGVKVKGENKTAKEVYDACGGMCIKCYKENNK